MSYTLPPSPVWDSLVNVAGNPVSVATAGRVAGDTAPQGIEDTR
jgi:hypothetical protein